MENPIKYLLSPLKMLGLGLKFLLFGKVLSRNTGARFAKEDEYNEYLHVRNSGLVLDGKNMRLSESHSFQNVCVMARVGTGKTSRYVIPNVLDKGRRNVSLVVNDPKGEVFEATSGYLQSKGYRIVVIDPENLERSSRFNPLSEARDEIELEQIAEIIVKSGLPASNAQDDFWLQGAIRFVSLFIKCLKNAESEHPEWFNLHNLQYLFQNFGEDGVKLENFMATYSVDIENPEDERLWNEWRGVLTGNAEGVQSFVLNAITALKALSNQKLAELTSRSDIELESIRHEKTAVFVITPAQHAEYYGFLVSLFFRSVFNACMRELPNKKTLPVYILYDEFGHSTIPNFVSTANTIRGYKVSLSIILQSICQLEARYGKAYADSIQGGFNSYITYSGADPHTCAFFENIIGSVRVNKVMDIERARTERDEFALITASQIRTIGEHEALIVSGNAQPVRLRTTPYFKDLWQKRKVRYGAYIVTKTKELERLKTVSL